MKSSRIAALIAAASLALILGLAACGGSDDSSSSDSSSETSSTPTTAETTPDSSNSQGGALTPPGTQLKVGEEATLAWVPFSEESATEPEEGIDVKVTVEAIEKGSIDDFANIELEPEEEESTPYYVKFKVEALSGTEPPPEEEPYIAFDAIDDRGQEQSNVTFIGDFETCENTDMPRPFTNGESFEGCLAYLVPGGGSIEKVEWGTGPTEGSDLTPYYDEPVVWEG
ncbi:MAG: hypothetical protein WBL45_10565 [Solirubrobacterales bacterium]